MPYGAPSVGSDLEHFAPFCQIGLGPLHNIFRDLPCDHTVKLGFRGCTFQSHSEAVEYLGELRDHVGTYPISFSRQLATAEFFADKVSPSHLTMRRLLKCGYPDARPAARLLILCAGFEFCNMDGWSHCNAVEGEVWIRAGAPGSASVELDSACAADVAHYFCREGRGLGLAEDEMRTLVARVRDGIGRVCVLRNRAEPPPAERYEEAVGPFVGTAGEERAQLDTHTAPLEGQSQSSQAAWRKYLEDAQAALAVYDTSMNFAILASLCEDARTNFRKEMQALLTKMRQLADSQVCPEAFHKVKTEARAAIGTYVDIAKRGDVTRQQPQTSSTDNMSWPIGSSAERKRPLLPKPTGRPTSLGAWIGAPAPRADGGTRAHTDGAAQPPGMPADASGRASPGTQASRGGGETDNERLQGLAPTAATLEQQQPLKRKKVRFATGACHSGCTQSDSHPGRMPGRIRMLREEQTEKSAARVTTQACGAAEAMHSASSLAEDKTAEKAEGGSRCPGWLDSPTTKTVPGGVSDSIRDDAHVTPTVDVASYCVRRMDAAVSRHPRAALEEAVRQAAEHLRDKPTLPADPENLDAPWQLPLREDLAVHLPSKHCAFRGCGWTGLDEASLYAHLTERHEDVLAAGAVRLSHAFPYEDRVEAIYNEAVAEKCRTGAPLSRYSIDRRCLHNYTRAISGQNVQEPICFMCGCSHPHLQHREAGNKFNHIEWMRPFEQDAEDPTKVGTCFGMDPGETDTTLSLRAYLDDYGKDLDSRIDLRKKIEEFDDWRVEVPFLCESVTLLCCPEDRRCENETCATGAGVCPKCEVPVCHECLKCFRRDVPSPDDRVPPQALVNDMMVFYGPRTLNSRGMTVVEMMCASVCITSMICFAMEVKHGHMMNSETHMQRHRVGARGNATSFPMPWHDLLGALQEAKADEAESRPARIPHDPVDLAAVIQVLLKSSNESDYDQMKKFIHQATVRRDVVVEAILEAKANGHRSYVHLDEREVRRRAMKYLPKKGIPDALIRLLPHDNDIDKIQIQKAATPVEGRAGSIAELMDPFKAQRPNAVIAERSCYDIVDTNATHSTAALQLAGELQPGELEPRQGKDARNKKARTEDPQDTRQFWSKVFASWISPVAHGWLDGKTRNAMSKACKEMHLRTEDTAVLKAALASFAKLPIANRRAYILTTGSAMIDQFEPWYFGVAFAFCFKYCTGMPDMPVFAQRPRHRRKPAAPRIELALWVRVMARRIESQLRRDWLLQFTTGNLLFRSAVNLAKTVYSYEAALRSDGQKGFTAAELEEGAISICKALQSTYVDPCGRIQAVKGDFTKVHRVSWLPEAAQCMMRNIRAMTRKMSGTDETRTLMRYDTNACRVCRGAAPLFVTMSPDEKHSMVMLRLARTRRNDPVCQRDPDAERFGGLFQPELGHDFAQAGVSVAALRERLPPYDERRAILARDPLASVDGCRLVMGLLLEYIFGVRFCDACPDCAQSDHFKPCMDLFGSNATPEGGVFGRVDGVYISIEAQKSAGSLHFHAQIFVQCLHQHCSLEEIYEKMCTDPLFDASEYLRYAEHTTRQVYADAERFEEHRNRVEEEWPEYKESTALVTTPAYLQRENVALGSEVPLGSRPDLEKEGITWLQEYLGEHVQSIQEKKQHHVHPRTGYKGERKLLEHCRRSDDPSKCKGDFPRDEWLLPETSILCPGLLAAHNMPSSGRRNKLGCIQALSNHGCLNASHPALMAADGSFNTDVQIPWRLPITERTHNHSLCQQACIDADTHATMVIAAAKCQAAQAGYACDYATKRLARGFQEVKEHIKGHHSMPQTVAKEQRTPAYLGKRHAARILSDAYGKDVVRSQQERTNLNANAKDIDPTAAETIRTSQREPFPGNELLAYIENRVPHGKREKYVRGELDRRDPLCKQWVQRDVARMYALRPRDADVWYLSPYEFWMYWEIAPALYAATADMMVEEQENPEKYHCYLTVAGTMKVLARSEDTVGADGSPAKLLPGEDPTESESRAEACGGSHIQIRRQPHASDTRGY